MSRSLARSAGWILALIFSIALSACGGEDKKGQMNDQNMPGMDHNK